MHISTMIKIKTPGEIEKMAEGGKILSSILKELKDFTKPGMTTKQIDDQTVDLLKNNQVKPAFLNYNGFPANICISLNDEVVHGIPSDIVLKEGDIISLDMGVVHKGFITDSAITFPVLGEKSYVEWRAGNPKVAELLDVTKKSLDAGIAQMKQGNRIGHIGHAIQSVINPSGFGIIRDLVGHGVGEDLHEEPHVPNYGTKNEGIELKNGMVLALEPMVSLGDWHVKLAADDWTYATSDGSMSAHFEHSIAITEDGPRVLTK
jgi:methionyl aminopeptidase